MGLRTVHPVPVLGEVLVHDDVPLVVEGAADEPGEDLAWIGGVGDAALLIEAIERRHVVAGDAPPVADAGAHRGPALDAGEHPLDAGAVEMDIVGHAVARAWPPGGVTLLVQG